MYSCAVTAIRVHLSFDEAVIVRHAFDEPLKSLKEQISQLRIDILTVEPGATLFQKGLIGPFFCFGDDLKSNRQFLQFRIHGVPPLSADLSRNPARGSNFAQLPTKRRSLQPIADVCKSQGVQV